LGIDNLFTTTTVTLAKPKYKLPDDGRRPKHVGAF